MKIKRYLYITILFTLILTTSVYGEVDKLPISASSAILIDSATGRVLYSLNSNKKLPMASTTKIMTTLVAIEKGDLDKKVKIKKEWTGIEGSSIYLVENEKITLRDLLYGLMLRSGNDAAIAIANHISGSVEKFSNEMNKKAKKIGLNNTNFENPHGLHDENHYTTAYDLSMITREAMKLKEFREISSAKKWTADREQNKLFYNKNDTLSEYKGGDGGKTGFTRAAGRCLVTSATRNGVQLIAVVLNDSNWFNDCYTLMDYGFDNYKPYIIHSKKQFIKNVSLIGGNKDKIPVFTEKELLVPLKEEEVDKVKAVVKVPDSVKTPIKKGDVVGTLQIFLEGELISTSNLISQDTIDEKGKSNKVKDFISNIFE
ncbi:D-alanyl-D-alanine carboxypeptidase DacB [Gottschalkia purinilytica]|uniref:serine-type D-Ala-D-Ala carboxypeptidase n=1 Tax=Gottschalkia purinilytica TaxID=1503 RepID=A0A0L0W7B0_GOTPU|nr:D-alanyl-D-alanine carboxypeptidase family protein [Gottschalkia purinilytica]KNF07433.1 D-alanyl-D-alanine carboxypeptidase DacB [Gottschalkia purinilytica]